MVDTQIATRSSKRKRAQVSYYEGDSDISDAYDSDAAAVEYSAPKKPQKTRSRPLPKKKIFPFLSLPAELRNVIYEYCLSDPGDVYLISKTERFRRTVERVVPRKGNQRGYRALGRHGYYSHSPSKEELSTVLPTLTPALLAVNKQIYDEALPILYDHNFVFEDTMVMHSFLANLGSKNCELVQNVVIREYNYSRGYKQYNHCGLTLLSTLPNLKSVYFDCRIGYGHPKPVARQLYRDGFHWLEAVGAKKGIFDAAVDLIDVRSDNIYMRAYYATEVVTQPSQEQTDEQMKAFQEELRRLLKAGMQKPRSRKPKKEK